jgi:hypothetical protein
VSPSPRVSSVTSSIRACIATPLSSTVSRSKCTSRTAPEAGSGRW